MSPARATSTEEGMVSAPRVRNQPPKTSALAHDKRSIDNANVTIYAPLLQSEVSWYRMRLVSES
jgi:hypothetical protein